ncbi:hypothetical protein [Halostagnicola sp. A-GB9-2]|uniref:hypothetical protein n=1 Tax=Halostagnicola sp. A-GB9-2 TaxID=3048066 RepID=UPI0024BF71D7|nr:hypothetical protein [Halostagnicola sp. A-GB9-2]MDJ1432146.1 hypothetical protein [Halostagnicola sp. A-GB9-2]
MSREAGSPSRDADDDRELEFDSGSSRTTRTMQSRRTTRSDRTFSRREALATAGTLSLGAVAGCLSSVPGLEGNGQELVEPTDPGDDPDGTPEEFHYWLEDNGIAVDELYLDQDDNSLHLFYESTAEEEIESNDEIVIIMQVYTDGLIEHGSDIENLFTEIRGGFDGQAEGWGIQTEWADQYLAEEISWEALFQTIMQTRDYGGDGETGDDDSLNESDLSEDDAGDLSDDGDEPTEGESSDGTETEDDDESDDGSTDEDEFDDGSDSTTDSEGNETDAE